MYQGWVGSTRVTLRVGVDSTRVTQSQHTRVGVDSTRVTQSHNIPGLGQIVPG